MMAQTQNYVFPKLASAEISVYDNNQF